MNEIVINVIAVVVTSVVIPLVTLLGAKLTQWINGRIKDNETKKVVEEINHTISSNVSFVFQTYVENLKKKDKFDEKAQSYALRYAQEKILNDLGDIAKEHILEHYGDINGWIITQIESTIYNFKK